MVSRPALSRSCRVASSLWLIAVFGTGPALSGETDPGQPGANDVLQVLADLTLIDSTCRGEIVNFGVGLGFASQKGVPEVAIMPGGLSRLAFETTLKARRASFNHDELCGEIAENYAEALPGSVTFTATVGQRP